MPDKILLTGVAGFIGAHVGRKLLKHGYTIIGIDNLNSYYDVGLKKARLQDLCTGNRFQFVEMDIADRAAVERLFQTKDINRVIHLAAQAGVRYSLTNPNVYTDSNIVGFVNILEGVRARNCLHLVYASSSSVYGANKRAPFSESDAVDHPVSLYAATKKSNELLAHAYSHLFSIPMTGLRFFTVYGPWGRPDMAIFKFVQSMLDGKAIDVYNCGHLRRDFTYIDDIVEGVFLAAEAPPPPCDAEREWSRAPHRLFNIGNNKPVELMHVIRLIEARLGIKAKLNMLPMQPGDLYETYADITNISHELGYQPRTSIEDGIDKFIDWYLTFFRQKQVNVRP